MVELPFVPIWLLILVALAVNISLLWCAFRIFSCETKLTRAEGCGLVAGLVSVMLVCGTSMEHAGELQIVPDSGEYVLGGWSLLHTGRFQIDVGGIFQPPRYPPWFSLVMVVPAFLGSANLGAAIFLTLAYLLIGAVAAFLVGRRLGGEVGAMLAIPALLVLPGFSHFSREILTYVPTASLCVLALLLYLQLSRSDLRFGQYLIAGFLCALIMSFRPLGIFCTIPFALRILMERRGRVLSLAGLLILPVILVLLTLAYNRGTFGGALYSGYRYWLPDYYEQLSNTFGWGYFKQNWKVFFSHSGMPLLLVLGFSPVLLRRDSDRDLSAALFFFALCGLPLIILHLFYFYPAVVFTLPAGALLAVLGAGGLSQLLPAAPRWKKTLLLGLSLLTVIAAAVSAHYRIERPSLRMSAALALAGAATDGGIIVSGIEEPYLRHFLPSGKVIEIVAANSKMEYVNNGPGAEDRRDTENDLEYLKRRAQQTTVLAETLTLKDEELKRLAENFRIIGLGSNLVQLMPTTP
ncbi:MAG: glycosyltransferase family 39 protein [Oligoflexia bacterium]|nr:glycosyltransferase family 39 protein [Oligoflexia bacterium]